MSASATRRALRLGRPIWIRDSRPIRRLERLNVRCDLQKRDAIYYATDADAAARLRREFDHRSRSGFHAEWLSAGALRQLTGMPAFGAIRTRGNAQFDPYRACAGIVRAAAAAGAEVYERSEVRRIDADRNRVSIRTRHGSVEADHVVIATGYATPQLRPLAGRFRMYRTYVLATAPLTRAERAEIGLSDVMIWNTSRPYHYARWTADHRLLLGGGDRLLRPGPGREREFDSATRAVRSYFESLLPGLAAIPAESAWEGLFALTADSLPYIGSHRRYRRHWFALGYGGNGMTFAALAARLLLEQWQGEASSDHALFGFQRS